MAGLESDERRSYTDLREKLNSTPHRKQHLENRKRRREQISGSHRQHSTHERPYDRDVELQKNKPYGFFLGFLTTLLRCIFCILVFCFFCSAIQAQIN